MRETVSIVRATCDNCQKFMGQVASEKGITDLVKRVHSLPYKPGTEDRYVAMMVKIWQQNTAGQYVTSCDLCPDCLREMAKEVIADLTQLISEPPLPGLEQPRAIRIPEVAVASAEENP